MTPDIKNEIFSKWTTLNLGDLVEIAYKMERIHLLERARFAVEVAEYYISDAKPQQRNQLTEEELKIMKDIQKVLRQIRSHIMQY